MNFLKNSEKITPTLKSSSSQCGADWLLSSFSPSYLSQDSEKKKQYNKNLKKKNLKISKIFE